MQEIEKRTVERINTVLSFQTDKNGKYISWFYCFGTLLEFVRSGGKVFDLSHDLDIGVLYNECNADQLISGFEGIGYRKKETIINDVTKAPLNLHFEPIDSPRETPYIDVFFWIESKGKLFHTYDYYREGSKIPSKYFFKGVDKHLIVPPRDDIKEARKGLLEGDRLLTEKGVWIYSVFGDHSGYVFNCPFSYGTLLDNWYPGWIVEEKHYGQSRSNYVKEVKSCKDL